MTDPSRPKPTLADAIGILGVRNVIPTEAVRELFKVNSRFLLDFAITAEELEELARVNACGRFNYVLGYTFPFSLLRLHRSFGDSFARGMESPWWLAERERTWTMTRSTSRFTAIAVRGAMFGQPWEAQSQFILQLNPQFGRECFKRASVTSVAQFRLLYKFAFGETLPLERYHWGPVRSADGSYIGIAETEKGLVLDRHAKEKPDPNWGVMVARRLSQPPRSRKVAESARRQSPQWRAKLIH